MGAATPKPQRPPINAPHRSVGGSQCSRSTVITVTSTPRMPPTMAPTKRPDCPAAWPRMEPMTAPKPAKAQVATSKRKDFKGAEFSR